MTPEPIVLTAATDLAGGTTAERFDGATIAARGGQVVVVPAGARHAFTNSGERTLEMTSIHPVAEMATEWIEEA
jgi:mannose-6-phosphate isomerase-like protein (cupin superfamily)